MLLHGARARSPAWLVRHAAHPATGPVRGTAFSGHRWRYPTASQLAILCLIYRSWCIRAFTFPLTNVTEQRKSQDTLATRATREGGGRVVRRFCGMATARQNAGTCSLVCESSEDGSK